MKIEYVALIEGDEDKVLDVVTVRDRGAISYKTGKARDLFEGRIEIEGKEKAIEQLKSWSNGYVLTREKVLNRD